MIGSPVFDCAHVKQRIMRFSQNAGVTNRELRHEGQSCLGHIEANVGQIAADHRHGQILHRLQSASHRYGRDKLRKLHYLYLVLFCDPPCHLSPITPGAATSPLSAVLRVVPMRG